MPHLTSQHAIESFQKEGEGALLPETPTRFEALQDSPKNKNPDVLLGSMLEDCGFFLAQEYEANSELAVAALMSVAPDRLSPDIITQALHHSHQKVRLSVLMRHDIKIHPDLLESALRSSNRDVRIAALCRPDAVMSSLAMMDMISTERDPATLVAMIGRGIKICSDLLKQTPIHLE
jgi:hypothetical protein